MAYQMALDLSEEETKTLLECENTIAEGRMAFLEVGSALLTISSQKLYRAEFSTFEAYLNDRWEISKAYAYRMINAFKIGELMSPIGDIVPENEAQVRALTTVPADERQGVWKEAVESAPEGKVTAKHVEAAAAKLTKEDRHRKNEERAFHKENERIANAKRKMAAAIESVDNFFRSDVIEEDDAPVEAASTDMIEHSKNEVVDHYLNTGESLIKDRRLLPTDILNIPYRITGKEAKWLLEQRLNPHEAISELRQYREELAGVCDVITVSKPVYERLSSISGRFMMPPNMLIEKVIELLYRGEIELPIEPTPDYSTGFAE